MYIHIQILSLIAPSNSFFHFVKHLRQICNISLNLGFEDV